MSREIKFRALSNKGWSPTEGKGWIYGTSIYENAELLDTGDRGLGLLYALS